ncbi:MAG: Na(+) H(+) antiporter subunit G, partial [uncultured Rubrobacteraceae bacterium]
GPRIRAVTRGPLPGGRPRRPWPLRHDRRGLRRDPNARHLHSIARGEQSRLPGSYLPPGRLGRDGRRGDHPTRGADSGLPDAHHPRLGPRYRAGRLQAGGENGGAGCRRRVRATSEPGAGVRAVGL